MNIIMLEAKLKLPILIHTSCIQVVIPKDRDIKTKNYKETKLGWTIAIKYMYIQL